MTRRPHLEPARDPFHRHRRLRQRRFGPIQFYPPPAATRHARRTKLRVHLTLPPDCKSSGARSRDCENRARGGRCQNAPQSYRAMPNPCRPNENISISSPLLRPLPRTRPETRYCRSCRGSVALAVSIPAVIVRAAAGLSDTTALGPSWGADAPTL